MREGQRAFIGDHVHEGHGEVSLAEVSVERSVTEQREAMGAHHGEHVEGNLREGRTGVVGGVLEEEEEEGKKGRKWVVGIY